MNNYSKYYPKYYPKFTTICIIVISIIIIVVCAFYKSIKIKEGLENVKNSIVLIGDSVLNNSAYVPAGKSVVEFLKQKTNNVFNFLS